MNTSRCIATIAITTLVSITACAKEHDSVTAGRDTTSSTTARADGTRPVVVNPAPAPDNTAVNKGDVSADAKTPFDQSQSSGDVKVTADIRRAIMDDKNMSVNAQNCKIITDKSGLVTLRGVVNSQAEKDSIEAKAKAVAGDTKVDNQLEVKVT